VLIIASGNSDNVTHTAAWTFAFTVGGLGCVINARRCGRVHCLYTGPLYLLAALACLLYGLRILPLGHHGWDLILGVTVTVTVLSCCVLEKLIGKYTGTASTSPGTRRA
jgi:peptidoglycan/LPS O-acetylase OafA/YrhL